MRAYTTDDTAVINDTIQAANLVTVSDTAAELRFKLGHLDASRTPQFVTQADTIIRIVPDPMSEMDEFGNKDKLYSLAATKLLPDDNGLASVTKFDISYPTTAMLHILEAQLRHFIAWEREGHTLMQNNESAVDWQAVAEELLTAHTATSESIDCRPCPLKEYCSRAPGESCYKYIKDVLCKKHTKEAHA